MGRIFCILTGYLCGSFLTAELVAQERIGKSAFEIGTGNPGMANLAEQGGVGCAFRVLAGDVGKTLLACLLCPLCLWSRARDSRHSLRRPWLHPGPRLSLLALVSRRKRRGLQRSCPDPHLAHGRPLFLPDRSHGCATHRLSPLRRGPDPRRLHPPGLPGIRPGVRLPDSPHDLHHAPPARPRPPEYDFGYGEEGGFAGDAEVRKL